jgi:hypothetical protein
MVGRPSPAVSPAGPPDTAGLTAINVARFLALSTTRRPKTKQLRAAEGIVGWV